MPSLPLPSYHTYSYLCLPVLTDNTHREDEIAQPMRFPQRERRFLGCVHMPLNAIYQMQTLEGTLRLEVRIHKLICM